MASGQAPGTGPLPKYFRKEGEGIFCTLCPHRCTIRPGAAGICGIRENHDGKLVLPAYGLLTAWASDPIEKKPLYHFHPGETVWSAGFNGCNLHCPFCQNHRISLSGDRLGDFVDPRQLAGHAAGSGVRMIAYTYSEPTIHIEYLLECAEAARSLGLLNVLVTNGNLNREPAGELLSVMDGVNVDLKSWSPEYYRKTLGGSLDAVKKFIEIALDKCWLEVTTLVVPGDNDSEEEILSIAGWLASLSREIPLHLSSYHPSHTYTRPATDASLMHRLAGLAAEHLDFIYIGNTGAQNNTVCPGCGEVLFERMFYRTRSHLNAGQCPECGKAIPGVFPG